MAQVASERAQAALVGGEAIGEFGRALRRDGGCGHGDLGLGESRPFYQRRSAPISRAPSRRIRPQRSGAIPLFARRRWLYRSCRLKYESSEIKDRGREQRPEKQRAGERSRPACDELHPQHHHRRAGRRQVCDAALGGQARSGARPAGRRRRRGEDPHALSARAERLPALRSRQVDLPQLRPGARLRRPLPPALRRHQPGEGRKGIRRFDRRCRALARLLVPGRERGQPLPRVELLRLDGRERRVPDRLGPCLRRQPERRGDAREPRHADRAGQGIALPEPQRRREHGAVQAHAGRRVRRRCADPAREDRHGFAEHQPARPGDLSHPPRDAPQHRRPLVRLSDVHLRAPDRGRAGEHHPLDLHARIRGPAAVLRLAARAPRRRRLLQRPLPQQIEFSRLNLTYVVLFEAQADPARRGKARRRLGRPAHADARRRAPARLHAGRLPALRRPHRRLEVRFPDRLRAVRGLHARSLERSGRAPHRRSRPPEARHRQLSRGHERRVLRAEPSAEAGTRKTRDAFLARTVDRARGLHGGPEQGATTAFTRATARACATASSSSASAARKTRTAR